MVYKLKNKTISTNVINTLIQFGAHLGDLKWLKHFDHNINYFTQCIRNDFFIIDLKITTYYLQRALSFIFKLSNNNGKLLFYHSYLYKSHFFKFLYFFLIKYKTDNSFINYKWTGGIMSNYKSCFLNFLKILSNIPINVNLPWHSKAKTNFFEFASIATSHFFFRFLFLKLLLFTYEKTFLKRDWGSEFKKLLVFWKAFIFIRSFKYIFNVPDCLICINPSNNWFPVSEYSISRKIPSISILDTSSNASGITYPIPSNDDSIPLSIFYVSIFINVWLISSLTQFNRIK